MAVSALIGSSRVIVVIFRESRTFDILVQLRVKQASALGVTEDLNSILNLLITAC